MDGIDYCSSNNSTLCKLGSGAAVAAWPTVDNLMLAAAVPEPATYALMAIGLVGVAGSVARRAHLA